MSRQNSSIDNKSTSKSKLDTSTSATNRQTSTTASASILSTSEQSTTPKHSVDGLSKISDVNSVKENTSVLDKNSKTMLTTKDKPSEVHPEPDSTKQSDQQPPLAPVPTPPTSTNPTSDSKAKITKTPDNSQQNIKVIEVKPAPKSESQEEQKTNEEQKNTTPKTNSTADTQPAKPDDASPASPTSTIQPKKDDKNSVPANPASDSQEKKALPNIKMAKKWGTAVDQVSKTKKKRRSSKVDEIDPFLAKYAVVKSKRAATQTAGAKNTKAEEAHTDEDDLEDEDAGCCERECCSWAYWRDYVIDPADPSWFYWSLICASATFYNMVVVFLRAVFTEFNNPDWHTTWFCFDYLTDFITILDMLVRCRLGFLEQGILVVNKVRLVKVYLKSFRFILDILSILPFDLVYLAVGVNTLLRLNRLFRVWRVQEFYHDSETRTQFPNMFRMIFLIINICLMIHWNACIYYSMSKAIGAGNGDWAYNDQRPGFDDLGMRYLYCFYWSMLTLTAIGDTDPPESFGATLYCIIVTLCGVLIFATIFGNVGAMINQMNASRQEFQQNVDAVKRYMDIRRVTPLLQDRVIQWFAYTWNNKQSVDDKQALTILPEKLRAEIAIQVHLDTLKKVAIFKDCEPGLLQELVLKLRLQVFSPGDYICRKGDIGKEMYIIKRGKLEVVSPDGKIVFVTMQDGAVFGEVSILNIAGNKTGNRRTASVRSVGYSDLFCLSKDDLWDALKEYPDARMMLWEKGKQILRKDNLLDEEAARKKELADMSLETKIDRINDAVEQIGKKMIELSNSIVNVQTHMGILPEEPEAETTEPPKK